MKKEEIKDELIKRYEFINENAALILAPYIKEEDNLYSKSGKSISLSMLKKEVLVNLEMFLLSDLKMESTALYDNVNYLKKDKKYLLKIKKGLLLLQKHNENSFLKLQLDIWKILEIVRNYIERQEKNYENRQKKLRALDEYFKIARYENNLIVTRDKEEINTKDIQKKVNGRDNLVDSLKNDHKTGLESDFINYLSSLNNYNENNMCLYSELYNLDNNYNDKKLIK